jgi:hypothetical protein
MMDQKTKFQLSMQRTGDTCANSCFLALAERENLVIEPQGTLL